MVASGAALRRWRSLRSVPPPTVLRTSLSLVVGVHRCRQRPAYQSLSNSFALSLSDEGLLSRGACRSLLMLSFAGFGIAAAPTRPCSPRGSACASATGLMGAITLATCASCYAFVLERQRAGRDRTRHPARGGCRDRSGQAVKCTRGVRAGSGRQLGEFGREVGASPVRSQSVPARDAVSVDRLGRARRSASSMPAVRPGPPRRRRRRGGTRRGRRRRKAAYPAGSAPRIGQVGVEQNGAWSPVARSAVAAIVRRLPRSSCATRGRLRPTSHPFESSRGPVGPVARSPRSLGRVRPPRTPRRGRNAPATTSSRGRRPCSDRAPSFADGAGSTHATCAAVWYRRCFSRWRPSRPCEQRSVGGRRCAAARRSSSVEIARSRRRGPFGSGHVTSMARRGRVLGPMAILIDEAQLVVPGASKWCHLVA